MAPGSASKASTKKARVVIVDDVCTTGSSTVQAIEAARVFGFEIMGVMCLVERQDGHGASRCGESRRAGEFYFDFYGD